MNLRRSPFLSSVVVGVQSLLRPFLFLCRIFYWLQFETTAQDFMTKFRLKEGKTVQKVLFIDKLVQNFAGYRIVFYR